MIVVVIGVAGSGKSTIGTMLAEALSCPFLESDALHSAANIAKMSSGTPLTDEDRWPWLSAIHSRIKDSFSHGEDLVVACSALRRQYRQSLAVSVPIRWVYLQASKDLIRSRLARRTSHFMKADMLDSQFEILEEPAGAIVVDASEPPDRIVNQVMELLPHAVDLRVSTDAHELSIEVARASVQVINDAVNANGTCSLALSGGETPRELYRLLGSTFRDQIPWERIHVFWGDERYVDHGHPDSNFRMARETLLSHVPCPVDHIHPMPTHFPSPEAAALDCERTLRQHFGADGPAFDLNLLGVGEDGHTASIFPGSAALTDDLRWVVSTEARAATPRRLTLTLAALTRSANLYVLVAGCSKASALSHVLSGSPDPHTYPAAGLRRSEKTLIWWVDRDAAAGLMLHSERRP